MLGTNLSVPCIAKLLGVSSSTIFRRMTCPLLDTEWDGRLLSIGLRVQWTRMAASMHRVDSIGILSRLASLCCVVRRTYSVRGPLSLVHVDTNHKLIRYNIVLFGGVDGYSRKVMYLSASTNNRASTAYGFFLEAKTKTWSAFKVNSQKKAHSLEN
ncbi:hypothetical protein F7725_009439 [Dissostichus mawsoni]|uniref:Integrase core domain-containing protein n=1 Tax=Dissostichus mawsoni TaxID=36200 RepID=A0A7J5XL33_DISMA|nr:hypothetical protein F7725_009439 [Dissostichus mawsoni]